MIDARERWENLRDDGPGTVRDPVQVSPRRQYIAPKRCTRCGSEALVTNGLSTTCAGCGKTTGPASAFKARHRRRPRR